MYDIQLVNFTDGLNNTDQTAYLNFSATNGVVMGESLLAQRIAKRILTDKGTNALFPNYGSNMFKTFSSFNINDSSAMRDRLSIAMKEVVNDLLTEQEDLIDEGMYLAPNEKLVNIDVKTVTYKAVTETWIIELDIVSEDNQVSKLKIPLTI